VLDAKQSIYIISKRKKLNKYRTLSFVYFDTHQLYKMNSTKKLLYIFVTISQGKACAKDTRGNNYGNYNN